MPSNRIKARCLIGINQPCSVVPGFGQIGEEDLVVFVSFIVLNVGGTTHRPYKKDFAAKS